MKITLNVSESDIAFIDGRLLEYQTRSSYIRDILRGHIRNTGGLAVGVESKAGAALGKAEEVHKAPVVLMTPVAPVKAPLPVDTRTELEKMSPEARAQFERTMAARRTEREAKAAQAPPPLTPEQQRVVAERVTAEVMQGIGLDEADEAGFDAFMAKRDATEPAREDDNGYLVGG